MRSLQDASKLPSRSVLYLRLESLQSDVKGTLERICNFLEIPFDEELIHPKSEGTRTTNESNTDRPLQELHLPTERRHLMNLHGSTVALTNGTSWEGLKTTLAKSKRQELATFSKVISRASQHTYMELESLGYHLNPVLEEMIDLRRMPKDPSAFKAAGVQIV